jgi:hypothetical protein
VGNLILDALAPPPAPTLYDGRLAEPPSYAGDSLRRGLKRVPLSRATRTYQTIDEGMQMIRDRITSYLAESDPGRMLLIAAPAGIGKTTLAIETAERWAMEGRPKAMYVGPRKDFFADIRALSAAAGRIPAAVFDNWWYPWQGHHDGGQIALDATCRYAGQIHQWMQRGYGALSFCQQPRVCGWDYIKDTCRYHRQRETSQPILYTQYEHVSLGHPLLDHCGLIIGDELPLRAFLYTTDDRPGWIIPPDKIVPSDMEHGELRALLATLATLSVHPAPKATLWSGPALLDALGGAAHVLAVCQAAQIPSSALAYAPALRSPYEVEDLPFFHLPKLVGLLTREAEAAIAGRAQIARVQVDRFGLHLLMRRTPANLPPHVIWLDATANAAMYETLFERPVEVVQPEVKLAGRIYQMWASLNNKGQFLEGPAESAQAKQAAAKLANVRAQIAQIAEVGYEQIGYIGHKSIIEALAPGPADTFSHFGGARGTNRFAECDCLIVVGTPQPTTATILDIATMLYEERDDPFDATWSTRDLPFADTTYAYPIGGFWNDRDLQTLLEQFRDAELVQAIHRARPLRRNIDIWLLTNMPLSGLAVELVSLHQLFGAPEGTDPYRWPAVTAFAQERIAAVNLITSADLVHAGLCTQTTAVRYIQALAQQQDWEIVTAPASGRGKPPIGCVKKIEGSE